jgi:hypothetical protein
VDPGHPTVGQFVQDEIATPLGEDLYIRLPEDIPNARLANLRNGLYAALGSRRAAVAAERIASCSSVR